MTAITVAASGQLVPNAGVKEVIILTDTLADSGYTFDATGYLSTIWGVYINDSSGVVKEATFSGLTVTVGSITQGTHCIRVWGI